eukprot:COSAG06_NODE_68623_length_213_cov_2.061404_1_plen_23_part_10
MTIGKQDLVGLSVRHEDIVVAVV